VFYSLKEEFSQDLQAQITQIRQDYNTDKAELDKYLSRPDEAQYQQILQEKSELEEQLLLQREEQTQIEEVKQLMMKEYEANLEDEKSNFDSQILSQTEKLQKELDLERSKFEEQILSQRDQFESEFESKLEDELIGDTTGDLRRLLVSLSCANRELDDSFHLDEDKIAADVAMLMSVGLYRMTRVIAVSID